MNHKREANYDLLRIICTIFVIIIHVNGIYADAINNPEFFGELYTGNGIIMQLYGTLSSIAVPCFFMLSGAFVLADNRNENYAYFYSKCMKNVGIQTIIFSVFYFLYSEVLIVLGIIVKGKEWSRLWIPIEDFVKGKPYYHMWYLYTLAGLYLLVPVILKVKNSVKEETFKKICIALFLVASISGRTSSFVLHWSITKVVCYLGYFTAGYQLRKWGEKKNNKVGTLFIILGVIGFIGIAIIHQESIRFRAVKKSR